MTKQICVIGCGRWGTFIGWYLDSLGNNVSLYGRKTSCRMKQLIDYRKNDYLEIPESIALISDLEEATEADFIVISVNAQHFRSCCKDLAALSVKNKNIILCMKGIEIQTGKRLSEIAGEELDSSNRVAVWVGPGHVQEFYRGVPNCMVIDSDDDELKAEIIECFSGPLIRFYYGTDIIGSEIGAAAKNVIGVAAGMLEGLGMSTLKGALMARGTREISSLICALGGKESSAYGLCHLGDYEATLFSPHSQNLAFGKSVITGESYDKLAEGFYTVKALLKLGENTGTELPICDAVYKVLYEKADPEKVLKELFLRSLKKEF